MYTWGVAVNYGGMASDLRIIRPLSQVNELDAHGDSSSRFRACLLQDFKRHPKHRLCTVHAIGAALQCCGAGAGEAEII